MKKLVVNADDFGRSNSINRGIIEAHEKGIVTSASLMTRRDAFDEAVAFAKAHPKLGIGLHLDLDHFFEVEHGVGRLLAYQDPSLPIGAIVKETEEQMRKIMSTGLPIHHVDGHHHVHLRPELFATVAALTAKYKIPCIRFFEGFYEGLYPGVPVGWMRELIQRFGLKSTTVFFAGWEAVESSLPGYRYWNPAQEFDQAELMVHPGLGEAWRERELAHCTSAETQISIEKQGIELINFGNL